MTSSRMNFKEVQKNSDLFLANKTARQCIFEVKIAIIWVHFDGKGKIKAILKQKFVSVRLQ